MVELNCDLISLNTTGLCDYEKRRKVFHYLKQQISKSAIIFMQETNIVKSDEKIGTNQFGCGSGSTIFSHGKSDARGVLIAFREELNYRVITQHVDNDGRYKVLNVLNEQRSISGGSKLMNRLQAFRPLSVLYSPT